MHSDERVDVPSPDAADSDEEDHSNKIFNVKDAVPPTDYDAPYSALPSSIKLKRVKQQVK